MLIRKCDRCGKEIKTNDIKYYLKIQKSNPKLDIQNLGDYDLCVSCYADFSNSIRGTRNEIR